MATGYTSDYGSRSSAGTDLWSRARSRPNPCPDTCEPACPACGGLKCLCRPRFFPGQLLTDEDLNRLEQYVVDKNRLHNRYLQGWGVACGLEVTCDVCEPGHVVVRSGYALSPCGDDIVVCNDQTVDVCSLINSCEPREPLCESPYDNPPRDCTGGQRKWVLAICYDERPVRGITAQLGAGDTTASARCKCGGSGSCGCGSGGSCSSCGTKGSSGKSCSCGSGTTQSASGTRKGYKAQCEPTQICEGYRFIAYPAPKEAVLAPPAEGIRNPDLLWAWLYANRARFGPLIERLLCCLLRAMELRQSIREGKTLDREFALSAYREYASALAEFAQDFAIHRCAFVQRAQQLQANAYAFDWDAAEYRTNAARAQALAVNVSQLDLTWAEIVSECLCSALLPACPAPSNSNCVPLATITISNGDCRVVEICNWSQRKLLISWPTIGYWFSWLPWHKVKDWIAGICCGADRGQGALQLMTLLIGIVLANVRSKAANAPAPAPDPAQPAAGRRAAAATTTATAASGTIQEAFAADNLLVHLLGNFDKLRTEGAAGTGQPIWTELIARFATASPTGAEVAPDPKIAGLFARLDAAEAKLQRQDAEIAILKRRK